MTLHFLGHPPEPIQGPLEIPGSPWEKRFLTKPINTVRSTAVLTGRKAHPGPAIGSKQPASFVKRALCMKRARAAMQWPNDYVNENVFQKRKEADRQR